MQFIGFFGPDAQVHAFNADLLAVVQKMADAGGNIAQFHQRKVDFKADSRCKGGFVDIIGNPPVQPTQPFRQRLFSLPIHHLMQQHVDRRRLQGGRDAMTGQVQQYSPQHPLIVLPFQIIQIAADKSQGVEHRRDLKMAGPGNRRQ